MYILTVPEDFRPEEYGWEVSNPIVAHQQVEAAMQELHRFGFVSTQYTRVQIPCPMRFVLTLADYSAEHRMYRVLYMRPFECGDEEVTRGALWDEIRWGFGRAGVFDEHSFAPQTPK